MGLTETYSNRKKQANQYYAREVIILADLCLGYGGEVVSGTGGCDTVRALEAACQWLQVNCLNLRNNLKEELVAIYRH